MLVESTPQFTVDVIDRLLFTQQVSRQTGILVRKLGEFFCAPGSAASENREVATWLKLSPCAKSHRLAGVTAANTKASNNASELP